MYVKDGLRHTVEQWYAVDELFLICFFISSIRTGDLTIKRLLQSESQSLVHCARLEPEIKATLLGRLVLGDWVRINAYRSRQREPVNIKHGNSNIYNTNVALFSRKWCKLRTLIHKQFPTHFFFFKFHKHKISYGQRFWLCCPCKPWRPSDTALLPGHYAHIRQLVYIYRSASCGLLTCHPLTDHCPAFDSCVHPKYLQHHRTNPYILPSRNLAAKTP